MRILIVDDDEDAAKLLSTELERHGHETAVANDADTALGIGASFVPEVAVLDVMICCESGYILADELRAVPGLADCRIVAMTSFTQERHERRSRASGFIGHLIKPFDLQSLLVLLGTA